MLLTIVAIWAIVIPLAVLAISWQVANLRDQRALRAAKRSVLELRPSAVGVAGLPACAVPAARPRRTITRRVCPARPRGAGRRPASA
jgi:hypothetical protein